MLYKYLSLPLVIIFSVQYIFIIYTGIIVILSLAIILYYKELLLTIRIFSKNDEIIQIVCRKKYNNYKEFKMKKKK